MMTGSIQSELVYLSVEVFLTNALNCYNFVEQTEVSQSSAHPGHPKWNYATLYHLEQNVKAGIFKYYFIVTSSCL